MQAAVDSGVREQMATRSSRDSRDAEFSAYMAARQPSLMRTAYLLTGNRHEAEELVQMALAKLYLSWDKVQRRELVDGYVRRILINEHHSLWRRAWKRREHPTDELPDHDGVMDTHDEGVGGALWEFVQTLPARQRAVVVLKFYEELSDAEVARTLGISTGTVKSQSSRALSALRARIHENPLLSTEREEGR
ncbi:MAG: SigE family RNA polymerase sigma factor [Nocardioidaceae bacterium]